MPIRPDTRLWGNSLALSRFWCATYLWHCLRGGGIAPSAHPELPVVQACLRAPSAQRAVQHFGEKYFSCSVEQCNEILVSWSSVAYSWGKEVSLVSLFLARNPTRHAANHPSWRRVAPAYKCVVCGSAPKLGTRVPRVTFVRPLVLRSTIPWGACRQRSIGCSRTAGGWIGSNGIIASRPCSVDAPTCIGS